MNGPSHTVFLGSTWKHLEALGISIRKKEEARRYGDRNRLGGRSVKQSKAKQNTAKRNKAKHRKTKQSNAMQSKAKQCKAKQCNKHCQAMQSKTKP